MANTTMQDKMKLAAKLFEESKFEDALNSFRECLELTSNEKALRIIHTNLGATHQRLGNFEDALKSFDSALSFDDSYLQALFNKGVTLKALEKFNEALETFNKVLTSNPAYYPALCGKCEVLCSLNQFDEALDAANAAIEVEPKTHVGYDDRAFVYLKMKKFQLALDDYNMFGEHASSQEKVRLKAIAMTYRGHELEREGKASDAIAMFDAVLKLEPTENRRFAYAVLLYKNNKQDDAEDQFRSILDANKTHFKSCAALGTILCEKGQYSEASSLLKRAYDGEEFDLFGKAPLMQNLAVSMVKGGKLEEGKQVFKDLVALEPENEVAKQALETLLGASAQAIDAIVKKSEDAIVKKSEDAIVKKSEESVKEAEGKKIAPVKTEAAKKGTMKESPELAEAPPAPSASPEKTLPQDTITVQKAEIKGPSADEKKVTVVKRKGRNKSIIAEEYLEKVQEAQKSVEAETENTAQSTPGKANPNTQGGDTSSDSQANGATEKQTAPSSPSGGIIFTLEQLQINTCPQGIDMTRREQYLSDEEFNTVFSMSKDAFNALPKWKRIRAKKEVGLF